MFLDEARVVARIQHPNVIPTIDFIEEEGELFMVMEYIEGATLGQVLHDMSKKRRKIPFDVVLRIMVDALLGLRSQIAQLLKPLRNQPPRISVLDQGHGGKVES